MRIKYQETTLRIQQAIKDKYKTQKDFAEACGCTESMVSRFLNGTTKLSLDSFIKICEMTGESPNKLIGWSNNSDECYLSNFDLREINKAKEILQNIMERMDIK